MKRGEACQLLAEIREYTKGYVVSAADRQFLEDLEFDLSIGGVTRLSDDEGVQLRAVWKSIMEDPCTSQSIQKPQDSTPTMETEPS